MQSFFFIIRNTLWVVSAMLIVVMSVLFISLAISLEIWRSGDRLAKPVPVERTKHGTTESEDQVSHPVEEGNVRSVLGMSSGDQSRHNE